MNDIQNYVHYRIFNNLNQEQIRRFENVIDHRNFASEEVIFAEGEVGDSLYLLMDGEVEINQALTLQLSKNDYDTREKSIINLSSKIHPVFGEMSLLGTDDKRTATVKAISDCKMGIIMKKDPFQICESAPEIGFTIMNNVASIVTDNLTNANKNVLKLTTAFSLILEK